MTDQPVSRPRLFVATLAFGGVVVALMQTIVVPLLPLLPGLTGGSRSDVSWLVTATLVTGAVCTPLLGRAGDLYGKRRMLLLNLGFMITGSMLCAISSELPVLIAGRALQGTAIAFVPLGISIMRDELPPERVVSAIAVMSSTIGVGAAFGMPFSALVVRYADWHTMFWVCVALGVGEALLVLLVVPESPVRAGGRFDITGALGLTAILVCCLLAVSKGGTWGWTAAITLGLFAAAAVLTPVWCLHQLRTRHPLVDLRVSARPTVLFTNLAALLVGFAYYANSLSTAQLVQEPASTGYGLGASVVVSGLCLLPAGVTMVLLSPVSARLSAAKGPRWTLAVACTLLALGYVVRLFTSENLATIIAGATVVAAGTAVAYSALPALIVHAVPVTETAAANGLNVLMRSIGQSGCSAVVGAVLAGVTATHAGHTAPTLNAYLLVFVLAGAAALAALVCTLLIPGPARQPTPALVEAAA